MTHNDEEIELLGEDRFIQIVQSLKHLHEHDVDCIMVACALEMLDRHGTDAGRIYRQGESCVCFAAGPASDLLGKQWQTWKREMEDVM